jgi:hypothetical protein
MMKQPANISSEVQNILVRLREGEISCEEAMAQLIPHIMACKSDEELVGLESAKEFVVGFEKERWSDESIADVFFGK